MLIKCKIITPHGVQSNNPNNERKECQKFCWMVYWLSKTGIANDLKKENLISSTFTLFVDYTMHHILIEFVDNRNSWEKKNMHQNMVVER